MATPTGITFKERLTLSAGTPDQAVCSDGTYLYATDSTGLFKYNKSGTLQTSHTNIHSEHGTDCTQTNGIFHDSGTLYITGYTTGGGDSRDCVVKRFDTDLVYIGEDTVETSEDDYDLEHVVLHDGMWWVVFNTASIVRKYNTSWVFQAEYALSYSRTGDLGYQGIQWLDSSTILVNAHGDDGGFGDVKFDVYNWTGSGFDEVVRLDPPTHFCTQGFGLEPGSSTEIWFCERRYDSSDVNISTIVKGEINYGGTIYSKVVAKDGFVYEDVPDNNYGDYDYFVVRSYETGGLADRAILQIDISDLPAGAIIKWARLKLAYYDDNQDASPGHSISVHKIDFGDWIEGDNSETDGGATWAEAAHYSGDHPGSCIDWTDGVPYEAVTPAPGVSLLSWELNWHWWDIDAIVADAIANESGIVRLLIKHDVENPGGTDHHLNYFYGRTYTTTAVRPVIEIEYVIGARRILISHI